MMLSTGLVKGDLLLQWKWLKRLGGFAFQHHALNLTLQLPGLILPLIVSSLLTVKINAYFYTAWMVANLIFVIPNAFSMVLFAVGSPSPQSIKSKIKITLKSSLFIGIILSSLVFLTANFLLRMFGNDYSEQAGLSLRILTIGYFPVIIRVHYISICRINQKIARATRWMVAGCLLELSLATLGAHYGGLSGLCSGWVIAIIGEAILMFPKVYEAVK